ncbi:hypothetical protein VII00023_07514 [Vibrio ichthyoenteri ATCC 700023]|uniref:Uncharacterized protein n=2 Tax=Vibrio ichthyoenteri TaxID=142461 RepID=F9S255_9VIBR|nr:hypothetical protein VII00023_07514 [Vibrio ichthyoenteri ATCC 700023]
MHGQSMKSEELDLKKHRKIEARGENSREEKRREEKRNGAATKKPSRLGEGWRIKLKGVV